MNEQLAPCPFCGGQIEGGRSRPILEEITEEAGGGWRVSCYGCRVGTWDGAHATAEAAVAAWNRRAPQAEALAVAERRGAEELQAVAVVRLRKTLATTSADLQVTLALCQAADWLAALPLTAAGEENR